jgi:hypothetical protein
MALEGSLHGWIESLGACRFAGAFVGEGTLADPARDYAGRAPAMKICVSPAEARQWVERQAADFGLPVRWISGPPRKAFD